MCFRSLAKTSVCEIILAHQLLSMLITEWPMLRQNFLYKSGVCLKGVGTNSIFCGGCSSWILKKRSGIPGSLKPDTSFRCKRCTRQARPMDGRPMTEVTVGREKPEVVPWGQLILGRRLWTRHFHKMPSHLLCHMGQVQWAPAHPHLPLISHHLQMKSLQFVCQECHASCKQNLGPNLILFASPATQWPSYDSLDAQCHHQGPSQLAGPVGEDAAWRSGKGTSPPPTQMARTRRT